ncbi:hypothetical protein ACQ4PT_048681 [Festuca glaucescens]
MVDPPPPPHAATHWRDQVNNFLVGPLQRNVLFAQPSLFGVGLFEMSSPNSASALVQHDYRNDLDIANAVATFGQYHAWNSNDPVKDRVLVYASFTSPQLVPRDVVFGKYSTVGGVKETWTAPVYILTADFVDALPADEDQMPPDGNPHPLPGNLVQNLNLFVNPQYPEVGWDAVQEAPLNGNNNMEGNEGQVNHPLWNMQDEEVVEEEELPVSMVINLSDSSDSSVNMALDVAAPVQQNLQQLCEKDIEEELVCQAVQTPRQKKSRKKLAPVVETTERRFTRSCLKNEGYRPKPVLAVQPNIKKKTRAKLLLVDKEDEIQHEAQKEVPREEQSEEQQEEIPVTTIQVLQSVGIALGIAPEKLTKDQLEADPIKGSASGADDVQD